MKQNISGNNNKNIDEKWDRHQDEEQRGGKLGRTDPEGGNHTPLQECRPASTIRRLSGVVLLLVLAIAITTVILIVVFRSSHQELCLSEQCVNTASRILRAMDRTVDPCADFYEYSCGNWLRENPIPDWTATWDRLAVLRESVVTEMRQLLEAPDGSVDVPDAVGKAKSLYRICMDTDDLERRGLQPIRRTLKAVGLEAAVPAASSTNISRPNFDWLYTIARSRRLFGLNILYGFSVTEDVRNSSLYNIVIDQVSPGFSEKFLTHPTKFRYEIDTFHEHIINLLTVYASSYNPNSSMLISRAELIAFADDVIVVATQIASVMTPVYQRRSSSHLFHEVTLEKLVEGPGLAAWKSMDWQRYMDIVFNTTGVQLDSHMDFAILLDLPYMKHLAAILFDIDHLKLERFVWWHVFSAVAPMTLSAFRSCGYEFSRKLLGLQARSPRWKTCTSHVNANFGLALSFAYIHARLTSVHKDNVLRMLNDVRGAFEDAVNVLDWMDSATRERTLSKLNAIRMFVGYPGWILNATELDAYYNQMNVIEGDLYGTFMSLSNASIMRHLQKIRKTANRDRWVASATAVNAFYSATLNSYCPNEHRIHLLNLFAAFPAGILKPPFYGNGLEAIDYGAIGAIMGHEITHGFDDQGRRYDEHGNLKQWWSLDTLEHYQGRVRCIIDQYSNYTLPELGGAFSVQGINTQGENIADNGGLRAALSAFRHRELIARRPSLRLPGLPDLDSEQLFFLGFAQIWCGDSRLGALKSKLVDGVHSPNRIRVVGTLSNSADFSNAWNCPRGAPMNPQMKCVLW